MFVQLGNEDITYLLALIAEVDADTAYTARQRAYTVPKLQKIQRDPRSARLAYQDVEYLLDLIEDSGDLEYEETSQQSTMTLQALQEIQALQSQRFDEQKNIEEQREARRGRRRPTQALAEHFEHVQVV